MKERTVLDIARDFSRYPAGRYPEDGPFPGAVFRDKHLIPALKQFQTVEVRLDGTAGYGSSFLEEAFGGLVRKSGYLATDLRERLKVVSSDTSLVLEVSQYIEQATPE